MATYLNKILLFLLLPTLLIANEKVLETIYQEVLITYSTIHTYETSFVQENYWEEIDVYKTSEGKLYYNKENLVMDYFIPVGQKLLINKNSMTMYDPISQQAIISDEVEIELRPDKLISHYWDVSDKELIEQFDDTIKIKLVTPEEEKIIITITNSIVTEFNIMDKNKNFVIYKFSDIIINEKLPPTIFVFVIPVDANILDTRSNK